MGIHKKITEIKMPEPEVEIQNKKINGNTEIRINLKFLSVLGGLLITIGSAIFGLVNTKLNDANDNINALEQKVEGYKTAITTVQSQNRIILLHYGIDIEVEAEIAAEDARSEGVRPTSLNGNN